MALISWKTAKVILIAGATVGAIGHFAGPDPTVTALSGAVKGTAWGIRVLGGTADDAAAGMAEGARANSSGSSPFGSGAQLTPTTPKVKSAQQIKADAVKACAQVPKKAQADCVATYVAANTA